jgi:hypothetical protein
MTNSASRQILRAIFDADTGHLLSASKPSGSIDLSLPSLDERVEIYLHAVHGADYSATAADRSAARRKFLDAVADDIAREILREPAVRPALSAISAGIAAIYASVHRNFMRFSLHTETFVPALAVLVLFVVGSAVWLRWPTEDFELGSAAPESTLDDNEASSSTATRATKTIGSLTFVVQILAERSDADLRRAYGAFQTRFPAILGNGQPLVRRIELGDNNVEYRAELGPYDSFEKAREICTKLSEPNTPCAVLRR